ncbi:MAG: penicillin-binding protein, partial [Sphingopyxis sp.]
FSSGLTTGVWMGRDDARSVNGLQGGAAPARAFADYMRQAVANRPIIPFRTAVELPQWQLESEDDAYFGDPGDQSGMDENGFPIIVDPKTDDGSSASNGDGGSELPDGGDQPGGEPRMDRRWMDKMTGNEDEDETRPADGADKRP